jgi:hypothetical protein
MQNPNLAWHSCSNRREKHKTAFANIVEGCLLYNFRIYHFCHTVQIFREMHGQSKVDRLKCSSAGALECRWRAGRPAGLALRRAPRAERCAALASVRARPHRLSRPSPRKACRPCCVVLARSELSRGPSTVPSARKLTSVAVPRHWSRVSRRYAVAIKAAHRPSPRKPQSRRSCQCRVDRWVLAPRGSGAKEPPKRLPYVPPNLPMPLVFQPRRPPRRSRSSSGRRRQLPPSSLIGGLTAPSPATNCRCRK